MTKTDGTSKAIDRPENASEHIGILPKHMYKHVRCFWDQHDVVRSFPGVHASGLKRLETAPKALTFTQGHNGVGDG